MSAFRESLAVLLRARFPVLYIESFEERRVLAEIAVVTGPDGRLPTPRPVYTWSMTQGLIDPEGKTVSNTVEPARALEWIQRHDQPAVFAFCDLHAQLGSETRPAEPGIVEENSRRRECIPARRSREVAHSDLSHFADSDGSREGRLHRRLLASW